MASPLLHVILPVGMLQCNCSIFGDPDSKEAIVIDPGDNIDQILGILGQHGLNLKTIIITHAHIDHIGGAAKLKAATSAPVLMNENDEDLYDHLDWQANWLQVATPNKTKIDASLKDGDVVELGGQRGDVQNPPLRFEILFTPGHTQGSSSIWIPSENKVIAGDTLFRDSIGRTDLPGGDSRKILRSIENKLLTLPDEAIVIAGHGPNTTIGRERERNPFLQGM
ncbi:MAG: MBL fold metallo-hydrolase [Bryobacteraceae bacterium]